MDAQLTRVRERIAVLVGIGKPAGRTGRRRARNSAACPRGADATNSAMFAASWPICFMWMSTPPRWWKSHSANVHSTLCWLRPARCSNGCTTSRYALPAASVSWDSIAAYPLTALDHVDLSAEPGVMGRADRFIESAAEYQPFARRLLGRTWLVDRMSTALRLAQSVGRGLEFVTSDGELIAADGTIIVGPRQAATGVLSRRSELRACHEQADALEQQLVAQAADSRATG